MLLKDGAPGEGTIIYTDFQSAGKGQPGNTWESEEGKNLLFTVILYPGMIPPADQFLISMTVSLGICDFLKRYTGACRIKWPNDIYAGNDKISGILIENSIKGDIIESCVIGIGLNVNQQRFTGGAPNPVSMTMISGIQYDLKKCLSELADNLDKRYKSLIGGMYDEIRSEYIGSLYRLDEWHKFKTAAGILKGRIRSVGISGILQIEDHRNKMHEFSFKEIEYLL